jgi:hypothetical protein
MNKKKISVIQSTMVADIKEAALLDRVTPFDSESRLVSDSILRVVWSLNTKVGEIPHRSQ